MGRSRSPFVFIGILILIFVIILITGDKYFYRMFIFLIITLFLSVVMSHFSLHGLEVNRICRSERMPIGQLLEEKIEVYNHSPMMKFWLEIRDGSGLPQPAGSRILTFIGPYQKRSYISYTYLSKRGGFLLSPIYLRSGDIFGLAFRQKTILTREKILVTPYEFPINKSYEPLGLIPGGKVQKNKSSLASPYTSGVRAYQPGDPLNHIHWKSTIRHDSLMVKEFDQDPKADVWIVIDACYRSFYQLDKSFDNLENNSWVFTEKLKRYRPDNSMDYLASIGASYAKYYIDHGQSVGYSAIDEAHITIPAESGERQYLKILDHLAMLEGVGQVNLQELITFQTRFLPRGSLVILITSSGEVGTVSAGVELAARGYQPLIILLDPINLGKKSKIKEVKKLLDQMGVQNALIGEVGKINDMASYLFQDIQSDNPKWISDI